MTILMREPFTIRRARTGDVQSMAEVQVSSWRESYQGIIAHDYLEGLSVERHAAMWGHIVTTKAAVFVAEFDDRIVGLASGGPRRRGDDDQGELYILYVLAMAQRAGIGRALFDCVHHDLAIRGLKGLQVRVLAANPACGFYDRLGGLRTGTANVEVGRQFLEELVFEWFD
jgi:GNAT superfamily N-acetyltransferase